MYTREQLFKQLEFFVNMIPAPIYWLSIDGIVLGANQLGLKAVGAKSIEPYIGKSLYEFYEFEIADNIMKHAQKVIETGETLMHEDPIIDLTTGELKYFTALRAPLRDYDGTIIGVIGTSINITSQKEAERLKLENLAIKIQEHEKFRKVADQMAHDLGSPLMALSVLTTSCAGIPETQRNMLKESASRIRDIAGSLLSQYKPAEEASNTDRSKELLVYAVLEQVIMDKQYEYQGSKIEFDFEYVEGSAFSFIQADAISFKRMLSNLINNSVESIQKNSGKIVLKLNSDNKNVIISVIDNGSGMPDLIIDKLLKNISVTQGKVNGHGIGFGQVHETLKQSNGTLNIDSKLNIGTTITLAFPKLDIPEWMVERLTIKPQDTVVILDDDNSIHTAWDLRFAEILKLYPNIQIKHFKFAEDVINFINHFVQKENLLLLVDYELLHQEFNGLDVIIQTKAMRSILVTSHYLSKDLREHASKIGTKILPKMLASVVDIKISD